MDVQVTGRGRPETFTFRRLSVADLDAAAALCDESVGKNLYPRSYLASILERRDHCFYLLVTPEGDLAGYVYFYLAGLDELAARYKLPRRQLAAISPKEHPVIGNVSSVGVAETHRNSRLSELLMDFALERLRDGGQADAAFGVCWKIGETVPMEKTMNNFGFLYLTDAHRVWYDNEDLVCPYCKGRCECDAAVYYKPLTKEDMS